MSFRQNQSTSTTALPRSPPTLACISTMPPINPKSRDPPRSRSVAIYVQCLHLVTLQDWAAGSEVKFSYGPLPNSRLLLLHGFCLPDNAFEAVDLWAMMEPGAPNYAAKSKVGVDGGSEPGRVQISREKCRLASLEVCSSNKFGLFGPPDGSRSGRTRAA